MDININDVHEFSGWLQIKHLHFMNSFICLFEEKVCNEVFRIILLGIFNLRNNVEQAAVFQITEQVRSFVFNF